ncbi:PLP-dependent transferase [Auriscalpium vulgare]|uniref:PLP-dependent transferase n=1 Tax=Auriscalpium vulgare TaxID=40419 RepID=A0ACB8RCU3_9AGAM|nr:PLP-dependent transferase [Auriscalpium vulgare]
MSSYDTTKPPHSFGHGLLKYFTFAPGYVNLNHGSYGSVPGPVVAASQVIAAGIEANPDKFMRLDAADKIPTARRRMEQLVGAGPDEVVFVPNASHGINTVLKNFVWNKEDIIVAATTTYNAVERTIQYINDLPPHPSISVFLLSFPTTRAAIIDAFRAHITSLVRAQLSSHQAGTPEPKIVAVIDSIASHPGVYLPWKELVGICREAGVFTVIDAAHSLGQEVDINLGAVKPDFWISNCHKWLYAKRPCAILYVPKRNQHYLKSPFPTPHSYVSPRDPPGGPKHANFLELFGWTGTTDFTAYMSVIPALDFRQWLGGEHKINEYCHSVAVAGGKALAQRLGTSLLDEADEFTLNMVNVELPLPTSVPEDIFSKTFFNKKLISKWNVSAATYTHNGKWWVRASAQVYTEVSDFEHLAEALLEACEELRELNSKRPAKM